MSKFHKLKVIDIVQETVDAVSVSFEVPDNFKKDFQYKQGKYLNFKVQINGGELRRSYSICSSPVEESELRVAIKKVKGGRMSTYMNNNIKVGDYMEVMIPMGNFYTELNPSNKKNYVLFAGGSGITPMLSILKTALKLETLSSVILFYGNNDEASIIFKKKIDSIADLHPARLKVYHVLCVAPTNHPEVCQGLMTKEKCMELTKNYVDASADNEYFVCGPGPMMDNVVAAFKELKINEDKVHIEYFASPVSTDIVEKVVAATPVVTGTTATIILDKVKSEVVLKDKETILEAAIR